MTKNRRKYLRLPAIDQSCVVTLNGQRYEAIAVNESIGGLCIKLSNPDVINFEQEIEIEFDGDVTQGLCRNITRLENNDFQLGAIRVDIQIVEARESAGPQLLLGQFVHAQGQLIFCEVLQNIDSEQGRIRLMDGKQLVTQRDKIVQLTRDERAKMLHVTDEYKKVVAIYQLLIPQVKLGNYDDILRHEFEVWANNPAVA